MLHEKLNKTEIKMLKTISLSKYTVSQLAKELNTSISWISECISHLEDMGFVETEKIGFTKYIKISSRPFCDRLLKIFIEQPFLNLYKILSDSKLIILPLLLPPGNTIKNIKLRLSLSSRTIKNTFDLWQGMGIISKNKSTKEYYLNPSQKYLTEFIMEYTEHRNKRILRDSFDDGIIIWQWRDEFIFSIPYKIDYKQFIEAGLTRLDEFDYDLIHTSQYYKYDPGSDIIDEEEAVVQAILINPENPRPIRILKTNVKEKKLDIKRISDYAVKYNIKGVIERELSGVAG